MTSFLIQESFNLFVGDAGPDNSKHLKIKNLKLPDLEELKSVHHAGGALGAIEVANLGHKELTSTFKLTGWDPQTLSQFGIGGRVAFPYTAYGNLRDKFDGTAHQWVATMFGRMTKATIPDASRGANLLEWDHEISEILIYRLKIDGIEKFYWNWMTSAWRVDGIVQNQDELTNLAIG